MPFGLFNALASFQDYINKTFAKKLDIIVILYLDNILVYTKDPGPPYVDKCAGSWNSSGRTVFMLI